MWIPENVVVERDPTWAGEILAIGKDNPLTLTAALPESEFLRRRVSLVVENVQQRESIQNRSPKPRSRAAMRRADPQLGRRRRSLHCDCYYQQRDLDESDRQVLATFAGASVRCSPDDDVDQVGAVRTA